MVFFHLQRAPQSTRKKWIKNCWVFTKPISSEKNNLRLVPQNANQQWNMWFQEWQSVGGNYREKHESREAPLETLQQEAKVTALIIEFHSMPSTVLRALHLLEFYSTVWSSACEKRQLVCVFVLPLNCILLSNRPLSLDSDWADPSLPATSNYKNSVSSKMPIRTCLRSECSGDPATCPWPSPQTGCCFFPPGGRWEGLGFRAVEYKQWHKTSLK